MNLNQAKNSSDFLNVVHVLMLINVYVFNIVVILNSKHKKRIDPQINQNNKLVSSMFPYSDVNYNIHLPLADHKMAVSKSG